MSPLNNGESKGKESGKSNGSCYIDVGLCRGV